MNQQEYERLCSSYEQRGLWEKTTHGEKLKACAAKYGDRIALIDENGQMSYRQLDEASDRMAAYFLSQGFERGDRMIIQHVNSIGFTVMCFAMFKIGVIPTLAMPSHGPRELEGIIQAAQPKGYIVIREYHGRSYETMALQMKERFDCIRHLMFAEDLEALELDGYTLEGAAYERPSNRDTAILVLSGGSTGIPKLISRPHADFLHLQKYCALSCGMDENSVSLIAMPVTHCWNLCGPGLFGSIFCGARTVLCRNGSADEILRYIEKYRVTTLALVPSLISACIDIIDIIDMDIASLEMLQIGGSMCPPQLAKRAMDRLGCTVQQIYGMSEGFVAGTRPDDPEDILLNTQGTPVSPGDILRIVDENDNDVPLGEAGQVIAKGPSVVTEYYNSPALSSRYFTEDGFYRTGDRGRILPESGRLQILGRTQEQINRLGEKIMPSELEELLLEHPDIKEVYVVPASDEKLGQRICVCLGRESRKLSLEDLRTFLRGKGVAAFKLPDQLIWVDMWPLTAVKKIDKVKLQSLAEGKGERCLD